jgi:hypothetical protein
MTINFLRGRSSAEKAIGLPDPAIGEIDAHVFTCPACARPLSNGTARCPGCGVHLIIGLRARQAGGILALGVAIGVLVGVAVTAVTISASLPSTVQAAAVLPSAAPAVAVPSLAPPAITIPIQGAHTVAMTALSGTAVVNGRIALDATTLRTTLADRAATTADIARALRSLAADAALGSDLTGRLGVWPAAAPVTTDLETFYRSMAGTARDGLRSSLGDNGSYRAAGAAMLKVLAGLGRVDAASRTLAQTVDLELPPVVLPRD